MITDAQFIGSALFRDDDTLTFRKDFSAGAVKRATLRASAYGVYEARINGRRVGDFVLAPGWTSYFNRIQYQTYDVTDMIGADNSLELTLATGWSYGMGYAHTAERKPLRVIAELELDYGDRREYVRTDKSWHILTSPTKYATIYNGEVYDATAPAVDLTERDGEAPTDGAYPRALLVPQEGEKIVEHESYPVREVIHTPAGETVLDFGYNLVGYVEFTLENAKAGDEISYTHAEILDKYGNFYTENLRAAKQRITYIAKDGRQTYKPRFTFMGGRYVRLDKYPYEIKPENFRFIVVHSDMKRTGYFECSNPLINTLYDNIIRGQRGNYLDVPTDCPQRDERLGWTGDAQVFVRAAAYNFDVEKFFRKWLKDLMLEQRGDGSIPSVIPDLYGLIMHKSSAWMDAATVCPWEIYRAYGDKALLERQFESMRRYVDFLDNYGGDKYTWNGPHFHYGDWLSMDNPDNRARTTPVEYIAQAFFALSSDILVKAGNALGKDVSYYEELHENVVRKFKELYIADGLPIVHTQTACVLALHFGLLDDDQVKPVSDLLCKLIHEKGDTLTTGFVGTPYLLHALTETGHSDLAYTLLLQDKFPSWLYSVKLGATTIWEHWNGVDEDGNFWRPSMNSYNHYAYGAVADWMFGAAAGINPAEPGYARVLLAPVATDRLEYVRASLETRHGLVKSGWERKGDTVTYRFTVPDGVTADVVLKSTRTTVGGGEHTFTEKL